MPDIEATIRTAIYTTKIDHLVTMRAADELVEEIMTALRTEGLA